MSKAEFFRINFPVKDDFEKVLFELDFEVSNKYFFNLNKICDEFGIGGVEQLFNLVAKKEIYNFGFLYVLRGKRSDESENGWDRFDNKISNIKHNVMMSGEILSTMYEKKEVFEYNFKHYIEEIKKIDEKKGKY